MKPGLTGLIEELECVKASLRFVMKKAPKKVKQEVDEALRKAIYQADIAQDALRSVARD